MIIPIAFNIDHTLIRKENLMDHNQIDLHMHSSVSNDAQFSPEKLMRMCAESGLKIVAIADHNSIGAFHLAQQAICDQHLYLNLIPAIELDCTHKGVNLHILGYGINPDEPWFSKYSQTIDEEDRQLSDIRANMIRDLGIFLEEDELNKHRINGILTGEMIGEVALEDERNIDNVFLKAYRSGGSRSDNPFVNFYWDFMAQGKIAYAEVNFISALEAVQRIKSAGGFAVFAHPGNNIGMDEELLKDILDLGLEGIEVYSTYHDEIKTQFYREKALSRNLLMTLGSDFHGKSKPSIKLGNFDCVDEVELTKAFLNRKEIQAYL